MHALRVHCCIFYTVQMVFQRCHHPFVLHMDYAFQTDQHAIIVLNLVTSGTIQVSSSHPTRREGGATLLFSGAPDSRSSCNHSCYFVPGIFSYLNPQARTSEKKKSSSSVRPSSVPLAENIMYVWLSYRTPKGYYIPGRLISYYGEHNMNVSWNRSDQNRVCCVNIESREISWILGPMCG